VRGTPYEIAGIDRTRRVVAGDSKVSACAPNVQRVVKSYRLEDGAQLVIAIGTDAKHPEREVDLCEGADPDGQ